MEITKTPIEGLLVLQPKVISDERGWFMESYNQAKFDAAVGHAVPFVQDNHSQSAQGVLRGLHYQLPPYAQGKLVRVTQGSAWDVAVDIRKSSPTFGQWFGLTLSATDNTQLWIPPGFAHGFVALEDNTHFLYKTTALYDKASERCIAWDDATLSIAWNADGMITSAFKISEKDRVGSVFLQANCFT